MKNIPSDWAIEHGEDEHGPWQTFLVGNVRQCMRWIPPGQFMMGSPESEPERSPDEHQHSVTISQGFWLARTPCTQALCQSVMGINPSAFTGDLTHPLEMVSWTDCQELIARINQARDDSLVLRLPTEAEWEYACRADQATTFNFGNRLSGGWANYDGRYPYNGGLVTNYRGRTIPVDIGPLNPWGLRQMHGNVFEFCSDWYGEYPRHPVTEPVADPKGPEHGRYRVLRGGSWASQGSTLRSAARWLQEPNDLEKTNGLRFACS